MAQYNIQVSVRNIIDYILRGGSIESVALSSTRAVDGTKAHQKFQKTQKDDYQVEVKLVHTCQVDQIDFTITGRMDGLFEEEGRVVIDEIKSTGMPLHLIKGNNIMHWAQVKMYGYIYAFQNHLMGVTCRLTYIELEDYNVKHFSSYETIEDLEEFYYDILGLYATWALSLERFKERCQDSIGTLTYPFATYRKGQKQLMHGVYKTIIEGQKLFARAPTGIGKTIATLYPAIKALGEKKTQKIFYLTAKTIGKEVANQTLNLLEDQGMVLKRVTITAKEKICLNEVTKCNKEDCPYALGHYDRVNTAIEAAFKSTDCYTREVIESVAKLHQVCPYELSLDLALFCEVIVCDYNYVFDPSAKLQRFFVDGSGGYTLLIDEAHNLVDRGRSMYSVVLEKDQILELRRKVKDLDTRLYKYMTRLNQKMLHYRKACENYEHLRFETKDMPYDIEDDLRAIIYRTEKIFKEHQNWQYMEMLLDFFFTAYDYVKKTELYSEKYITSFEKKGNNLRIHLYCMDPSDNIRMATNEMKGVVYFSATLLPMSYYMDLLGGNKENYGMMLSSPFDSEKLGLVIDRSISTKYKNRESSIGPIGEHIMTIAREKKGNYLVFFPSYKYMEDVLNDLVFSRKVEEEFDLLYQERGLTEAAKEAFIQSFETPRERSLIAFSVLGGMFSEGIDLVGNRLIGVLIVGVGLPMICYENDLIKEHFGQKGFDYAYVYPGMNKVLQAAGRVIRTVHDKGVVVLLDERFAGHPYKALFPLEWSHYKTVVRKEDLYAVLDLFWNGENMNKS